MIAINRMDKLQQSIQFQNYPRSDIELILILNYDHFLTACIQSQRKASVCKAISNPVKQL